MAKELLMRHVGNSVEVYYEGGGELPKCLQGLFTDRRVAQQHIDKYLHDKNRMVEIEKEIEDVSKSLEAKAKPVSRTGKGKARASKETAQDSAES